MSTIPTGDQGQRYEVSFYDPRTSMRQVLGWTAEQEGVNALVACINLHPVWEQPQVLDRQNASGPEHLAPQPAPGLEFNAQGVLTKRVKKRPPLAS